MPEVSPPHFFLIEDEPGEPAPQPAVGGTSLINQVGVQAGAAPLQANVVGANNSVFQQVIRNITPPKFTGRAQDWTFFVQDWERFFEKTARVYAHLDECHEIGTLGGVFG